MAWTRFEFDEYFLARALDSICVFRMPDWAPHAGWEFVIPRKLCQQFGKTISILIKEDFNVRMSRKTENGYERTELLGDVFVSEWFANGHTMIDFCQVPTIHIAPELEPERCEAIDELIDDRFK